MKKIDSLNVPETRMEKLRVLKEARKMLDKGFTKNAWFDVINGVHSYCLFGALEAAMGYDFENNIDPEEWGSGDSQSRFMVEIDAIVSSCSLTDTLFQVADITGGHANAIRYYDMHGWADTMDHPNHKFYIGPNYDRPGGEKDFLAGRYMEMKVNALQGMNDIDGKHRVLEVVDAAIKKLEEKVANDTAKPAAR